MEASIIVLSHDVEEKWVCVIVKGFVVEEQLGKEAEVLCIGLCVCWGGGGGGEGLGREKREGEGGKEEERREGGRREEGQKQEGE